MDSGMRLSGVVLARRYRLESLLGRGGMGEVWLGRDAALGREVAVKVLPALSGTEAVRRFRREAATLAGLQHPGITVVHDVGGHDGHLFIVMELLRGRDLSRLTADHPRGLPLGRVVDLVGQTAAALAAAHESGVVHRDLKPANLFVQNGDRIKICDFGIARTVDAASPVTASAVIGTPPYMSPEQWRADAPDARTDLYSLGCVLFELLTGQTPFPTAGRSWHALMLLHLNEAPPLPRSLRADVPARLQDLVLALLAKNPDDRPDTHTVTATLADPDLVRPLPPSDRDPRSTSASTAGPHEPTGGGAATARSGHTTSTPDPTRTPAPDHDAATGPTPNGAPGSDRAEESLRAALELYRDIGNRRGQANTLNGLGDTRRVLGDPAGADPLYREALDIYRDIGDRRGQANALNGLGDTREALGDYAGAEHLHREALDIYRDIGNRRGQANALNNLGYTRQGLGDSAGAEPLYREALDIYRDIGYPLGQANALLGLGRAHRDLGDHRSAETHLQQAVDLYREIGDRLGQALALTALSHTHRALDG